MKILKSWLQDHIEETLPSDAVIVEALTMKSSEVEGVEKVKIGGKDDAVFDIKTLPDRSHYMLSHRGVAYDLCAILDLTLKTEQLEILHEMDRNKNSISVAVESELCRRYVAVSIKNISNKSSPEWLQVRLEAIGARSINAIVDATNYAMFDTGQPLHAFDAEKVVGGIVVRLAREGEIIDTLSGQQIKLKPHQLVIADEKGPLALAGVKGGKRAEVDMNTSRIILESANFNPVSVRKTSFEVCIRNDSSKRFENEITPYLTERGVTTFFDLIEKISPKCKIELISDVQKELPKPWTISVTHSKIESLLNFTILEQRVVEILERLECIVKVKNGVYKVIPPFERLDLIIPEDIIDEVGRIEGLDKVKSVLPKVQTNHAFSQEFLLIEKIKDFFEAKGFSEIQTRSFANKGDIEVAYPMASDKGFLRTSLVPQMSDAFKLALYNAPLLAQDPIRIFEIGKTFPISGEQLDLCFGVYPVKKIKNKDQAVMAELNALAQELEETLGVKIGAQFGYAKNLEQVETSFTLGSIQITKGNRERFTAFSSEPFIVRDIALFVSNNVSADEVCSIIHAAVHESQSANDSKDAAHLVKGPDLFDEFTKDDKKSLGFRMVFQAQDRTLTDDEINMIMDKVYSTVREKGWEVR